MTNDRVTIKRTVTTSEDLDAEVLQQWHPRDITSIDMVHARFGPTKFVLESRYDYYFVRVLRTSEL